MSRYPTAWMRRMRRLKENGYMKPPPLYDFINSLPELSSAKLSAPKRCSYPEDDYIQAVYDKFPEVKNDPIDLNSFEPPLARRFAWRQLESIRTGSSPNDAFELAAQQFKEEIEQTQEHVKVMKSALRIVQEEEERVLHRALIQHRKQKERELQSNIHS